ncbi:MAG: transposase [Acidobacteria bacterium]|nr:transposase [Acidobacteriota bacterium]
MAQAISARRKVHGFLVTAWIFLPDHWHAILYPCHPLTISDVMESIKVSSTRRINRLRGESGALWQGRFFDRAVRTVKEYHETVEYIHSNAVRAGLVSRPQDWPWSGVHDYAGMNAKPMRKNRLVIDRVVLPSDPRARI